MAGILSHGDGSGHVSWLGTTRYSGAVMNEWLIAKVTDGDTCYELWLDVLVPREGPIKRFDTFPTEEEIEAALAMHRASACPDAL